MSHDNRVYLNTTLNNVVVIDSEQNQIAVTHPITQVIEITQTPTPTVTVVEETPNNVSVTEAVGNTVIVSANGPQGIQGIRGADPELTALELFTGSIQTQVNLLQAATSSYVQNNQTASMLQPYVQNNQTASMLQPYVLTSQTASMSVLSSSFATTASYALNISDINTAAFVTTSSFNTYTGSIQTQINTINNATSSYVRNSQTASMSVATASLALTASLAPNYVLTSSTSSMSVLSSSYAVTASRLEGMFTLTANSAANNRTISSIGGLAFNNNASIDQDAQRSIILKTTPDGNVSSLSTRLTISGSGQVFIARPSASYTLHTDGTFGLGTGGSAGAAAFTYDGSNVFTFRNSGGDNGLSITTNISTNNIQAIVRPMSATSNPGFALAPASASNANANHLVIGGLRPDQRPNIGIGTFTPFVSASLTVSGGVILGGTTSLISPWNDWSMQIQAGGAGKAIGLYSDIVGQYGYGTSSPSYLFAHNGSSAWRLTTSTNQGFSIDSIQPSTQQRVYVSASGYVGIGTTTPLSNLHVHKDPSGAPLLGLNDGITLTLENDTTNYINFRSPDASYAGLAFTTPADNSAGYIALRQSTGDMIFSNEKNTGYHTFLTADTERLRIANTETTVRNNLFVSGATSQFTASGTSLFNSEVDIFGTNTLLNISSSSSTTNTINLIASCSVSQSALTINQVGPGSAIHIPNGRLNLGFDADYNPGGRLHVFGNFYLRGRMFFGATTGQTMETATSVEGSSANRTLINFGAVGDSYFNTGNLGVGTTTPTQKLTVVGSSSFSGDVTISKLLTLTPQHPLPTLNLTAGAFAVSSSTPPKPYFYDGTGWNALY